MSNDDVKSYQINEQNNASSSRENLIPQSLKDVLTLLDNINGNLEDCAMEWQSKISKQQWQMLKTEVDGKSLDPSLLCRTYFTDKIKDEAFQKLLTRAREFVGHFNQFTNLLQDDPVTIPDNTEKNDEIINPQPSTSGLKISSNVIPPPAELPLDNNKNAFFSERQEKCKKIVKNYAPDVQQCFSDLIKAKIVLDTKFLGFEAILNGGISSTITPSENLHCLCQICSNALKSGIDHRKILDTVRKSKIKRRTAASSPKRRGTSTKLWKKNDNPKQSVSLVNIVDESMMNTKNANDS